MLLHATHFAQATLLSSSASLLCIMANSTSIRVPILILVLLLMLMTSSEARTFHGVQSRITHKRVDSSSILRDLLMMRYEYNYRRAMEEVGPKRLRPGGPDPQHHSQPPTVS